MRRYPGFDEKKLGFSGFKKLMARAAEDGNIKADSCRSRGLGHHGRRGNPGKRH